MRYRITKTPPGGMTPAGLSSSVVMSAAANRLCTVAEDEGRSKYSSAIVKNKLRAGQPLHGKGKPWSAVTVEGRP